MQTISFPYSCNIEDQAFITRVQQKYSAAVRTAFANCLDADGKLKPEKAHRDFVKARHAGGLVDAWALHCATLEARDLHNSGQPRHMVFGGRANLERRRKRLISAEEWRKLRLRPFCSRGDKFYAGNRHFKLAADGCSCTFSMLAPRVAGQKMEWVKVQLDLPVMTGNAGIALQQVALLAAEKKINVMFRIDQKKLHVTFDPLDLPAHPERRRPVRSVGGRCLGIDLNPGSIGFSVVENKGDASRLHQTKLLDHEIAQLDLPVDASAELMRETLAAIADRIIRLARKWGVGLIGVENGLGKLRSVGYNRAKNRQLNYWARTVFVQMLTRKARLAGIDVVQVWAAYSTTIGNIAFNAPDAAAAGAEIARRALARRAGLKEVLPGFDGEIWDCRRKDFPELENVKDVICWQDSHRAVKAAKIGYRRPHPEVKPPDPDDRPRLTASGHAVLRLGQRRRPGILFRPVSITSQRDSLEKRVAQRKGMSSDHHSTRKSG